MFNRIKPVLLAIAAVAAASSVGAADLTKAEADVTAALKAGTLNQVVGNLAPSTSVDILAVAMINSGVSCSNAIKALVAAKVPSASISPAISAASSKASPSQQCSSADLAIALVDAGLAPTAAGPGGTEVGGVPTAPAGSFSTPFVSGGATGGGGVTVTPN